MVRMWSQLKLTCNIQEKSMSIMDAFCEPSGRHGWHFYPFFGQLDGNVGEADVAAYGRSFAAVWSIGPVR